MKSPSKYKITEMSLSVNGDLNLGDGNREAQVRHFWLS